MASRLARGAHGVDDDGDENSPPGCSSGEAGGLREELKARNKQLHKMMVMQRCLFLVDHR